MTGEVDQIVGAAGQFTQDRWPGGAAAHQDARRGCAGRGLDQAHQLVDLPIRSGEIAGGVADDEGGELPAWPAGIAARRLRRRNCRATAYLRAR